jgi:flagellar biosynthetic protein FliQ
MTSDKAIELFRAAAVLAMTLSGPALLAVLVVGLIIGLLQTVTQLHEQSLSFIPKMIVLSLVLMFVLPWGLERLSEYAIDLIRGIPASIE